jgi:hypothetical protein
MINILSANPTKKNKSTKKRERRRSLILEMLEDRRLLAGIYDFGDAPKPYKTTMAEVGAHHQAIGPQMGVLRDAENDGTHSNLANADGMDEDGVVFGTLRVGQTDAIVIVNLRNAPNGARLDGWIDFNRDGNWGGSEEQVFLSHPVIEGDNILRFAIPSYSVSNTTFARFRVSTLGGLSVGGYAADGEIEDYAIEIVAPSRSTERFSSPITLFDSVEGASDVIDFDGDGDFDLVGNSLQGMSESGLGWLEQTGPMSFVQRTLATGRWGYSNVIDWDRDGDIDLIASQASNGTPLQLFRNDGVAGLTRQDLGPNSPLTVYFSSFNLGDIDSDGDWDIIAATEAVSATEKNIFLLINEGAGSFTTRVIIQRNEHLYGPSISDINSDGLLDFVYTTHTSQNAGKISVVLQNENLTFTENLLTTTWGHVTHGLGVDFEEDGDMDVLSGGASQLNREIELYLNNGSEVFSQVIPQSEIYPYTEGISDVFPADLNGDGKFDIVWGDWWGRAVGWIPHTTTSPFSVRKLFTFSGMGNKVKAVDFDQDGDLDIIGSNANDTFSSSGVGFQFFMRNESFVLLDKLPDQLNRQAGIPQDVSLTGLKSNRTGGSTLKVTATSSNPSLLPTPSIAYSSPNDSALLTFTPSAGRAGASVVTVYVEDAGIDGDINTSFDNVRYSRDFVVTVDAQNTPPSLDSLNDLAIAENAALQTLSLTGLSAGSNDFQPIRVTATSSNPSLIPNPTVAYTSPNTTGSLSFKPVANQFGTSTITVNVEDGGLDGDIETTVDNLTVIRSFSVTVNPINDLPTIDALSNLTIKQNAGKQIISLSGITAGGGESQPLRVSITSSNSEVILNPTVDYVSPNQNGSISFMPSPNTTGTTLINIKVEDSGLDGNLDTTDDNGFFIRQFSVTNKPLMHIYWDNGKSIYRGDEDGTDIKPVITNTGDIGAMRFDIDPARKRIITASYSFPDQNTSSSIHISNLDGLNRQLLRRDLPLGIIPQSITFNPINGNIYYSPHALEDYAKRQCFCPGGIQIVSPDSVSLITLNQRPWYVQDMEVDSVRGHVFYDVHPTFGGAPSGFAGIRRMNLDGSNDIAILSTGGASWFALDKEGERIYFMEDTLGDSFDGRTIYRMNMDGTNVQTVITLSDNSVTIFDVDIDSVDRKLVWLIYNSGLNTSTVQRANLDGTGIESLFTINGSSRWLALSHPSNTDPTLDSISNFSISENSPPQDVNLTNITAGLGESQPLRLTATSSNPSLIPNPTVTYTSPNTTGSLSFTPVANQFGTSAITVNVEDGGLDNDLNTASDNASFSQSFVVTVNQRNDLPAIALSPIITSLPENGSTPDGMVVADIVVTDDDRGTNSLFLSGPDSSYFQIISSVGGPRLQLVPDALLDYEAKPLLELTVNVDDSSIGTMPDASVNYRLDITNIRDAVIIDRRIFYHRSLSAVFGNGSGNPNAAIDPSKFALLPGEQPSFANYSNYVKGLNGLIIDMSKLTPSVTVPDFAFATWNGIDSAGFVAVSATPVITLFPGGGSFGSDRVKIEFPDDAIRNTWLRVTVLANANTDLASNDVFYFGNAVGDFNVGNLSGPPVTVRTNASDTSAVRQNQSIGANSAAITNVYDINKDGRVNSADTSIVRQHQSGSLIRFFTAPASLQLALAPDETDTVMSNTTWLGELDSTTSRRRRNRLL